MGAKLLFTLSEANVGVFADVIATMVRYGNTLEFEFKNIHLTMTAYQSGTEEPTIFARLPTGYVLGEQVNKDTIFQQYTFTGFPPIGDNKEPSFFFSLFNPQEFMNHLKMAQSHSTSVTISLTRVDQTLGFRVVTKKNPDDPTTFPGQSLSSSSSSSRDYNHTGNHFHRYGYDLSHNGPMVQQVGSNIVQHHPGTNVKSSQPQIVQDLLNAPGVVPKCSFEMSSIPSLMGLLRRMKALFPRIYLSLRIDPDEVIAQDAEQRIMRAVSDPCGDIDMSASISCQAQLIIHSGHLSSDGQSCSSIDESGITMTVSTTCQSIIPIHILASYFTIQYDLSLGSHEQRFPSPPPLLTTCIHSKYLNSILALMAFEPRQCNFSFVMAGPDPNSHQPSPVTMLVVVCTSQNMALFRQRVNIPIASLDDSLDSFTYPMFDSRVKTQTS